MNLDITYVLGTAACLVALACGHEASAPSALSALSTTAAAPRSVATREPMAPTDPDPAKRCIQVDDELGGARVTLEGRVFVDPDFAHPTRGKTRPFILRLDAPRCALGTEEARIVEVHLASSEGITLKPLVGRHVRVSGDPFTAHTAWHARPVVLMATTIAAVP